MYLRVFSGVQEFFPQTDGNYPALYFCSTNFSHKLTGIIQHYSLFTEFFPQTDGNYPTLYSVHQIFPTNRYDFSHKPTWFFPQTHDPSCQETTANKAIQFKGLVKPNFINKKNYFILLYSILFYSILFFSILFFLIYCILFYYITTEHRSNESTQNREVDWRRKSQVRILVETSLFFFA